ncbi:hypothetical protein GUJ93_ZPchr0013g36223 [Zizania palustris]|uniref:Legume lectin domain-containing protein n=1 Tax=Zizania palustris TaxID=103762 RepID=A0A8J6BXQ8_ZIZPA|nr:hypothetical protein GUJ93_ZPchr0013g36223 [Zizania palustris]
MFARFAAYFVLFLASLGVCYCYAGVEESAAGGGQFAYQGFAAADLSLDGLAAVTTSGLLALTNDTDHGLAFVVAPTTNLSTAKAGQYQGLLNATNGTASDPILAVELDTIMNPEFRDISSNHVGLDVNSLMSLQAQPVGYYDDGDGAFRDLRLNSHKPMQVWVDYDGVAPRFNKSGLY